MSKKIRKSRRHNTHKKTIPKFEPMSSGVAYSENGSLRIEDLQRAYEQIRSYRLQPVEEIVMSPESYGIFANTITYSGNSSGI